MVRSTPVILLRSLLKPLWQPSTLPLRKPPAQRSPLSASHSPSLSSLLLRHSGLGSNRDAGLQPEAVEEFSLLGVHRALLRGLRSLNVLVLTPCPSQVTGRDVSCSLTSTHFCASRYSDLWIALVLACKVGSYWLRVTVCLQQSGFRKRARELMRYIHG